MIREAQAQVRKQRFLLFRYALIMVTGAIGFVETQDASPGPIALVVLVALFSNIYLSSISSFSFFDAAMQAPILVADTAMVASILLLSRASQEFFLFFFFVLLMAAKIENLLILAIVAVAIGFASLLMEAPGTPLSPLLMRIPFMLATSLFYGYVVLPERTGEMTPFTLASATAGPKRWSA